MDVRPGGAGDDKNEYHAPNDDYEDYTDDDKDGGVGAGRGHIIGGLEDGADDD